MRISIALCVILVQCGQPAILSLPDPYQETDAGKTGPVTVSFEKDSWEYFLQHLPVVDSVIVDYRGRLVDDQDKQAGVIPFDVGKKICNNAPMPSSGYGQNIYSNKTVYQRLLFISRADSYTLSMISARGKDRYQRATRWFL